jgi:hypothetical protein
MKAASVPVDLIEELVSTFVTGGRLTMPPGRRDEVVGLLTRLVVNPEFREVYCRAAAEARQRAGVDRRLDAAADSGDIPEVEIARSGFGGLTDEQLADYAVCPAALNAIAERLYDDDLLPELGVWFIRAGKREVRE